MKNTKVLFVSQEITPYLPESEISIIGRNLPQGIQERGREIRTFMPKYGCINERRNQLHEVIRLSGMNLIIDDTDHPLIIKVASIQSARMQVYFIDNEDYFQRKNVLADDNNKFFDDNDERAIFFARGVIETVRKLRWAPDIIHCHGWFTSLVPLYIKKAYHEDPLFMNSKVIFSIYKEGFDNPLNTEFINKLKMESITDSDISVIERPTYTNLIRLALSMSDGAIIGSPALDGDINNIVKGAGIPLLGFHNEDSYMDAYSDFYDEILTIKVDE